jgi:hypothetical protein
MSLLTKPETAGSPIENLTRQFLGGAADRNFDPIFCGTTPMPMPFAR